jgi:hypothetical protein
MNPPRWRLLDAGLGELVSKFQGSSSKLQGFRASTFQGFKEKLPIPHYFGLHFETLKL